jgi:hypothetical protein
VPMSSVYKGATISRGRFFLLVRFLLALEGMMNDLVGGGEVLESKTVVAR